MPKTRSERYELYRKLKTDGPKSFKPQKLIVAPNTEIEVLVDASDMHHDYHYVELKDGVHSGRIGYLASKALLECDSMVARVGMSNVATTGAKYGGRGVPKGDEYQTSFVARGRGLHFALPFQGKEGCAHCGATVDRHTIDESEDARRLARLVLDDLAGLNNRIGGAFMIGVLQVLGPKNSTRLAVSDGFPADRSKDLQTIARTRGLMLIDRNDVNDWDRLRDCTGNTIRDVGDAKIDIKRMYRDYLQCAGPKLIQSVLHAYQTDEIDLQATFFMSEIWFNRRDDHANYQHGEAAESCGKCAILIPRMLCGYKPKVRR